MGGGFEPHMDSVSTTLAVVTLCGVRSVDIYRRSQDHLSTRLETFRNVEYVKQLEPGSIMLIDGQLDSPHCCLRGGSKFFSCTICLRSAQYIDYELSVALPDIGAELVLDTNMMSSKMISNHEAWNIPPRSLIYPASRQQT